MSNFQNIQSKLQEFVKKYYTNELIKGLILFSSFGLLYFIFTLLVEYFLWLQPTMRTILFWVFIFVEFGLLIKYIVIPIAKLFGIQKGISIEEASKIIGNHFKEVDDKLLNIIQLNNSSSQSELLIASINQKSKDLEPIPFKRAIDFTTNKKHLKYLAIPLMIWLVTLVTGNSNVFTDSYKRVVNHQIAYEPPAPFSFHVLNDQMSVVQGKPFKVSIETRGKVIPEDVQIRLDDNSYFIQNNGLGSFEYSFLNLQEPVNFYFESNGVKSKPYSVDIIKTPIINQLSINLDYPSYTKKQDEVIVNTGTTTVPSGTKVTWNVSAINTDTIAFISDDIQYFKPITQDKFEFNKALNRNLDYQISSSNSNLKNYESLNFSIQVIQDEYPKIEVQSDIDSISKGPVQFIGQLSDDYGFKSLELIYYDKNQPKDVLKYSFEITNSSFQEFHYIFPDGLNLQEGISYDMYFQVSDNDYVNGFKTSRSKVFSYYNKTETELKNQLLDEQKSTIEDFQKSIEKSKEVKNDFQKMQEVLQNKSEMNWNDQKKLSNFLKRQEEYEQMMQRQTEQLEQNLKEQPSINDPLLKERKKDLEQRLRETKELAKQEKLLDELKELAEKLNKEQLTEKLKKLTEQNKQNERSLERILELTKRFYVEQKMNQIQEKLKELAKKQEELANNDQNSSHKQKELNKQFDDLKKELNQLDNDNKELQKPMDLPDFSKEEQKVDEQQKLATDKLEEQEEKQNKDDEESDSEENSQQKSFKSAQKNQKSAAQKMKQMSGKMQESMMSMQGESMDEDIAALRVILENLVEFSFQQEDLIDKFSSTNSSHPDYSINLKKQYVLQEYFEHIDDSLYTLSLRQPRIGSSIFKDLAKVHYHLEESITHFTDNQFNTGVSDQQFVMTSANNIAYLLSNILDSMQNSTPSIGQGKGKNGQSFSLPDIIQKQDELMESMKKGMKDGKQNKGKEGKDSESGEKGPQQSGGSGEGEQINGELYEIYKQQSQLRQLFNDKLGENTGINSKGNNASKLMEELEQEILERGFTNEVLDKMLNLKHELLKLENAINQQGKEEKRESITNDNQFNLRTIDSIKLNRLKFIQNEILNRQSIPLQSIYKKKVQEYFKYDTIQL